MRRVRSSPEITQYRSVPKSCHLKRRVISDRLNISPSLKVDRAHRDIRVQPIGTTHREEPTLAAKGKSTLHVPTKVVGFVAGLRAVAE